MTKIGRLTYLNCAPVYYGIDIGMIPLDAELLSGIPSELNRWLSEGKLDLSPISAIEYARHQTEYRLLPNLCLNSEGLVKSVLLVSNEPIENLDGKKIALTRTSATSQVLLKILLSEKYGFKNEFIECEPVLESMLLENDAGLLIGDDALTADIPSELNIYDIGKLWREHTGHPVIFVVFAVRLDYYQAHLQDIIRYSDAFYESLMVGLANIDDIANMEQYKYLSTKIDFTDYFSHLNYEFDKRKMDALLYYYEKSAQLGFSPVCKRLEFSHFADAIEPGTCQYKSR